MKDKFLQQLEIIIDEINEQRVVDASDIQMIEFNERDKRDFINDAKMIFAGFELYNNAVNSENEDIVRYAKHRLEAYKLEERLDAFLVSINVKYRYLNCMFIKDSAENREKILEIEVKNSIAF